MIIDMQGDDEHMDMFEDMMEEYIIDNAMSIMDEEDLLDHIDDNIIESFIHDNQRER